jgi:hypothetical protein
MNTIVWHLACALVVIMALGISRFYSHDVLVARCLHRRLLPANSRGGRVDEVMAAANKSIPRREPNTHTSGPIYHEKQKSKRYLHKHKGSWTYYG